MDIQAMREGTVRRASVRGLGMRGLDLRRRIGGRFFLERDWKEGEEEEEVGLWEEQAI